MKSAPLPPEPHALRHAEVEGSANRRRRHDQRHQHHDDEGTMKAKMNDNDIDTNTQACTPLELMTWR